jgi:hypothetical protein
MDMTTSPKDGSYILVLDKNEDGYNSNKVSWTDDWILYPGSRKSKRWCVYGTWQDEQGGHETVDNPLGWMPLPQPPQDKPENTEVIKSE